MNQKYKISIIVPAYNVEKYIEQCLRSIMNQTYRNLEIIVVNDGSKDSTGGIIEKLTKEDNRIKVITQENQGLSESRNNAMQIVKSDFIMFVDGDDWIEHNTCETVIREFEKENPDSVWFAYIREYEKNSIKKGAFNEKKIIFEDDDIEEKLQKRLFGPTGEELSTPEKLDSLSTAWGKVYKTECLRNCFFKSFKEIGATCEDIFFNIEALDNVKKVVYINENLYHYRKFNPLALTKKVDIDLFEKWKKSYFLLNEIINNKKYDVSYEDALKNRIAINLIAIGLKIKNCNNTFKEKYRMIDNILHDEIYIQSIKKLNVSFMPIHWKMFFWNARMKNTFVVYILLTCISFLSNKK